jgi:hypothetical protein
LEEKQKKSACSTNGTNGNQILINQIMNEDTNQIEALRESNFGSQNYYQNQQGQHDQPSKVNRPVKCTHCKKLGHIMEKGFVKFPSLRPQNQKTDRNQHKQNTSAKSF